MKVLEIFNLLVSTVFIIFAIAIICVRQALPAWFWANPTLTVVCIAALLYACAAIAFARALVLYASGVVERAAPQRGYDFTTSLTGYGCAGFILAVVLAFCRPEHASGLQFFAAVMSFGGIGFALFCAGATLSTPWFERLEKEKGRLGANP